MIPSDPSRLRIVTYPDPILRKKCVVADRRDQGVKALAERMLELMHEAKGVGLAAPQVGVDIRLFVYNITGEPEDNRTCVNPTLEELNGAAEQEEGCLSIPGAAVNMRRATHAILRAEDLEGAPFELTGDDLLARVWQHELDHLNGRLIVDNMSATDEIANRRALKQLREEYDARR